MPLRVFDPEQGADSPFGCVADVVRAYLDDMDARASAGQIKPESAYRARFYCGAFSKDFGTVPLAERKRGDVAAWLLKHPEYAAPHTMHDAAGAVATCFKWAEDAELIENRVYRKPRDLPTPEPRAPIRPEEVRAMLLSARTGGRPCHRKARTRFRLALWFLWETGCRTCEMYKLRWDQYDDARGCFTLPSKSTRKTGQQRILVLTKRAWRLCRWLRRTTEEARARATLTSVVVAVKTRPAHVFTNGLGRPWKRDTFGPAFRRHANKAGVRAEISAYCLRHGFCCEHLEAGCGERQLADVLGHASTRYVAYYGRGVRQRIDYLRAAAELRK